MCNVIWNSEPRFYLGLSRFSLNQNKFSWSLAKNAYFLHQAGKGLYLPERFQTSFQRRSRVLGIDQRTMCHNNHDQALVISFWAQFLFCYLQFPPNLFLTPLSLSPLYITPNAKDVILLYVCQGLTGTEIFLQAYLEDKLKLKVSALRIKAVCPLATWFLFVFIFSSFSFPSSSPKYQVPQIPISVSILFSFISP